MNSRRRNPVTRSALPRREAFQRSPNFLEKHRRLLRILADWGLRNDQGIIAAELLGWPQDHIGAGSYALAWQAPNDPDLVIKMTNDPDDGESFAYLFAVQEQKSLISVPRIHSVRRVHAYDAWIIEMDRITPLCRIVDDTGLLRIKMDEWSMDTGMMEDLLEALQQRRSFGKKPAPEQIQVARMMLRNFCAFVRARAKEWEDTPREHLSPMLASAANAIEELVGLGVIPVDIHYRNWGLDPRDDRLKLYDLGVASAERAGHEKTYEELA